VVTLFNRLFPEPQAAKVPELIFLFGVVKILTTAGGEATSDYRKTWGNIGGGGTEGRPVRHRTDVPVSGPAVPGSRLLVLRLRHRHFRYRCSRLPPSRCPHSLRRHHSVMGRCADCHLFVWHRTEGTLSIHSITMRRRECFYWATVFAAFALGTALGDFTPTALGLGYLASGILVGVIILIPALAWWHLGLNAIVAFWSAYVVTRPLGPSFADYISRPANTSGIGFGDGPTAVVFTLAVAVLVLCLAVARPDIQPATMAAKPSGRRSSPS
jgi:uncharacterized membrane-anchored protein